MDTGGDDDDFPEDSDVGKKFALFDEQLQCPVCRDFFDNPHSLRCGHSFCSGCIRRHLDPLINKINADTCPLCKSKAEAFDLRPNTALGSIVSHYKELKPDALSLVKNGTTTAGIADEDVVYAGSSSICGGQPTGTAIIERMKLFSFHGLKKDKVKEQLVKVCGDSKVKLRLDGEKDALEKRLRNFIHLRNAQIGSLKPLTLEQVIRKVTEDEAQSEKEAYKAARSAGKLERVRNGEVVKEFEDRFAVLTRQLRQQKEAVKKQSTAPVQEAKTMTTLGQSERAAVPSSSGAAASGAEDEHVEVAGGEAFAYNALAEQSARTLLAVERLLQNGFDFAPWRVLISERLARPFFYNSDTRVGQFAVPAELADLLSGPEAAVSGQGIAVAHKDAGSVDLVAEGEVMGIGTQTRRRSQRSQEDSVNKVGGGHVAGAAPSQMSHSSQRNDVSHSPTALSAYRAGRNARGSARVQYSADCDPAEEAQKEAEEEESPFHMLADDSQVQATGRGASQEAFHALTLDSSNSSNGGTGVGSGFGYTAASTAKELPLPTPHPGARAGIAARGYSGRTGDVSSAESDAGEGGAGYPHLALSRADTDHPLSCDDGVEMCGVESANLAPLSSSSISSSATHWACTTCTYHNKLTTDTCEMCLTVDKAMQGRITTPWLRSSSSNSSSGRFCSSQSVASQKRRPSSQSTQGSSKKPKRK